MSRFHEELIKARREGTAPGMQDSPPAVEDPGPTFMPDTGVPLVVCSRCGSMVPVDRAPQHADWHRVIND